MTGRSLPARSSLAPRPAPGVQKGAQRCAHEVEGPAVVAVVVVSARRGKLLMLLLLRGISCCGVQRRSGLRRRRPRSGRLADVEEGRRADRGTAAAASLAVARSPSAVGVVDEDGGGAACRLGVLLLLSSFPFPSADVAVESRCCRCLISCCPCCCCIAPGVRRLSFSGIRHAALGCSRLVSFRVVLRIGEEGEGEGERAEHERGTETGKSVRETFEKSMNQDCARIALLSRRGASPLRAFASNSRARKITPSPRPAPRRRLAWRREEEEQQRPRR